MLPKMKGLFSLFFLDIKIPKNPRCGFDKYAIFEQILALVKQNGMLDQVVLSSYDEDVTRQLGHQEYVMGAVDSMDVEAVQLLSGGYYRYFMAPYGIFTGGFMREFDTMHNRYQQKVWPIAYIVDDIELFKSLKAQGVRYVMTDNLAELQAANLEE